MFLFLLAILENRAVFDSFLMLLDFMNFFYSIKSFSFKKDDLLCLQLRTASTQSGVHQHRPFGRLSQEHFPNFGSFTCPPPGEKNLTID